MRKSAAFFIACIVTSIGSPAFAQFTDGKVKIGVLTESSGVYADLAGTGSIVAAQMAVDDFGGKLNGKPV